jgi:predicted nucleotidyltransferase
MKPRTRLHAPQGALDAVWGEAPAMRILRYLCRVGGIHSGRAIGQALRLSHSAVHRALRPLTSRQIVDAESQGRAILYRLNEEHWLVQTGIRPLFEAESSFFPRLGEAVRTAAKVPLRSVILFGSLARGETRPESDIDLLCLAATSGTRETAEANLHAAAPSLQRQFGRPVSCLVWSTRQFQSRYRLGDPLVREILNTGDAIAGVTLAHAIR